jgi:hypothetical protein
MILAQTLRLRSSKFGADISQFLRYSCGHITIVAWLTSRFGKLFLHFINDFIGTVICLQMDSLLVNSIAVHRVRLTVMLRLLHKSMYMMSPFGFDENFFRWDADQLHQRQHQRMTP